MSESPQKIAKLEWESDEDFIFPLATNMVINFDTEHFYIRFYQASAPTIFGGEIPDTVKAKLVAGIAIPASRLRSVVEAIQGNYQQYLDREREDADFGLDEENGGDESNEQ